jgi:hypothetical protein
MSVWSDEGSLIEFVDSVLLKSSVEEAGSAIKKLDTPA